MFSGRTKKLNINLPCKQLQPAYCQAEHSKNLEDHTHCVCREKTISGYKKECNIGNQKKTYGCNDKIDDLPDYAAFIFVSRIYKDSKYNYVYRDCQEDQ